MKPLDVRGMLGDEAAALFERIGLDPLPSDAAFATMRSLAASGIAQATVAAVRWNTFAPIHRARRARPMLARVAPLSLPPGSPLGQGLDIGGSGRGTSRVTLTRSVIERRLLAMVAEILGTRSAFDRTGKASSRSPRSFGSSTRRDRS